MLCDVCWLEDGKKVLIFFSSIKGVHTLVLWYLFGIINIFKRLFDIFQRVALRLLLLHLQPVHLSLLGPSLGADDVGDDAGQEEGHHVAAEASHHETDGSLDPRRHLGSQCHLCYSAILQLQYDTPKQQQQVVDIYFLKMANKMQNFSKF